MDPLRVLVVDDEEGIRLGVCRVLSRFVTRMPDVEGEVRFAPEGVETGEAALERIEEQPPDIVLLDHKLPGLSGLEVLERLRGRDDLLTVMITAYASIETAVAATKRGAHDFLAKPFTPEELNSAVYKTAKHLLLQREARRLAAEKRQVRFQLLSVLAHELKTPIAAVEGYLELIRSGVIPPDSPKLGEVVARSVDRLAGMRRLIADLLDLTRIESGTRKREIGEVDVAALAARVLDGLAPAAAARGITLALHAPERLVIQADPTELEMVLNNLGSNAVKYNRDGGRVDITVEPLGAGVRIVVADNGIGMGPAEVERLFGEFVRIKNERTKGIIGTGLGLSIVKKVAEMYGGTVKVESEPDRGTTFTVTLPAEQPA